MAAEAVHPRFAGLRLFIENIYFSCNESIIVFYLNLLFFLYLVRASDGLWVTVFASSIHDYCNFEKYAKLKFIFVLII